MPGELRYAVEAPVRVPTYGRSSSASALIAAFESILFTSFGLYAKFMILYTRAAVKSSAFARSKGAGGRSGRWGRALCRAARPISAASAQAFHPPLILS
jgi:hypothetical protein